MLLLNTSALGFPLNELQPKPSKERPRVERRSDVSANDDIAPLEPLHKMGRLQPGYRNANASRPTTGVDSVVRRFGRASRPP
jgi:hypothetical protein